MEQWEGGTLVIEKGMMWSEYKYTDHFFIINFTDKDSLGRHTLIF